MNSRYYTTATEKSSKKATFMREWAFPRSPNPSPQSPIKSPYAY
ncbi:MAG: hypothetical protein VKL59_25820 [Nostocaceae cyanobacterium]|nr:hypothetical protein [Nostocaceae cyanobacterium]